MAFLRIGIVVAMIGPAGAAPGTPARAGDGVLLRYHLKPGETLAYTKDQRIEVNATEAGAIRTMTNHTVGVQQLKVLNTDAHGNATVEYSVRSLKVEGTNADGEKIELDSESPQAAGGRYGPLLESIKKPMFILTVSPRGEVVHVEQKQPRHPFEDQTLIYPMPEQKVTVGHHWTHDTMVTRPDLRPGAPSKMTVRRTFTLQKVEGNLATIGITISLPDPPKDPRLAGVLIQFLRTGTLQFDLARGLITTQTLVLDRSVKQPHAVATSQGELRVKSTDTVSLVEPPR